MMKLSGIVSVLGVIALVGLGGCGGKKDDAKKDDGADPGAKAGGAKASGKRAGGCDRRAQDSLCGEYLGIATADWVKEQCEAYGSPYVEACPKDDAIGRCVRDAGTGQETHTVFYAPMTKEAVTAMCSGGELRDP